MQHLNNDNKSLGLNIQARPSSLDLVAQQRTIFPMEAFEFDDPNVETAEPTLRMKPPWKLIVTKLTAEALDASFIEATEPTIGYEGVDIANPVAGDRRLVIKAFILTLQHYGPTEDGAGIDGWVSDIALGGFDSSNKFVDYIQASGITQNKEDASLIKKGLGLPPAVDSTQFSNFMSYIPQVRLGSTPPTLLDTSDQRGTYQGIPYYAGNSILAVSSDDLNQNTLLHWEAGTIFGYSFFTQYMTCSNDFLVFNVDLTALTALGRDLLILQGEASNRFYKGTEKLYVDAVLSGFNNWDVSLNYLTGEIYIGLSCGILKHSPYSSTITTATINTGLFVKDGINKLSLRLSPYYQPALVAPDGLNWRKIKHGIRDINLILENSGGVTSSNNVSGVTNVNATDIANDILSIWPINYVSSGKDNRFQTAVDLITFGSVKNIKAYGIMFDYATGGMSSRDQYYYGIYIDDNYSLDVFNKRNEYFSLIDSFRDISLIPSSKWGKNILVNGGILPGEYSDKYITVTGPIGPIGLTGPIGPQGVPGYSHVDGGSASSVYQTDQIIDGGNA